MALNSQNVQVFGTGIVSVGPENAVVPTAGDPLPSTFRDVGYINEDGPSITPSTSTTAIKGWQNADKVREFVSDSSLDITFVPIELTRANVGFAYGQVQDGPDGFSAYVDLDPSDMGKRFSLVIEGQDTATGQVIRFFFPSVARTGRDEMNLNGSDPFGLGGSFTAYKSKIRTVASGTDENAGYANARIMFINPSLGEAFASDAA